MRKIRITTDMIIGIGLCIALIIALIKGSNTEICIGIASNLGGYMGRSLMVEHLTNSSAPVSNAQETQQTSNKIVNVKGA